MKIRNGFVSNSSSSSFIIRGMKISIDEAIKKLSISQEEINDCNEDDYEVYELISSKFEKMMNLSAEADGNYFEEKDYTTVIVGDNLGYLSDGEFTELKDYTTDENEKLLEKFEAFGFTGKLSTFVQMISNDNY